MDASLKDVMKAYYKLSREWHPDKQGYDNEMTTRELAQELSSMVNEAMMVAKANAKQRGERF